MMPIGKGVVLIGMGERIVPPGDRPGGARTCSRTGRGRARDHRRPCRSRRAAMHLDTVFTLLRPRPGDDLPRSGRRRSCLQPAPRRQQAGGVDDPPRRRAASSTSSATRSALKDLRVVGTGGDAYARRARAMGRRQQRRRRSSRAWSSATTATPTPTPCCARPVSKSSPSAPASSAAAAAAATA